MDSEEFHGIVINVSQKDRSVLKKLDVIGRKKVAFGVSLLKVRARAADLEGTIKTLQSNLADRYLNLFKNFYFHFYRSNEVIVVFKERIFRMTTDKTTWNEVCDYGRSLGIPEKQLDFFPCRLEEETY